MPTCPYLLNVLIDCTLDDLFSHHPEVSSRIRSGDQSVIEEHRPLMKGQRNRTRQTYSFRPHTR